MDDDRTEPDEATLAEERAEATRAHTADRPATDEESAAADAEAAAADQRERESVAQHEQEMQEIGANVKGEGAID